MPLGRFLIRLRRNLDAPYGSPEARPVAGLYASSWKRAEVLAAELFPGDKLLVEPYKLRSGWRDSGGLFLVNEGSGSGLNIKGSRSRGCRYICKACGLERRGRGAGHNHRSWCEYADRNDVF